MAEATQEVREQREQRVEAAINSGLHYAGTCWFAPVSTWASVDAEREPDAYSHDAVCPITGDECPSMRWHMANHGGYGVDMDAEGDPDDTGVPHTPCNAMPEQVRRAHAELRMIARSRREAFAPGWIEAGPIQDDEDPTPCLGEQHAGLLEALAELIRYGGEVWEADGADVDSDRLSDLSTEVESVDGETFLTIELRDGTRLTFDLTFVGDVQPVEKCVAVSDATDAEESKGGDDQ